jgi:hypothetical protein
MVQPAVVGGNLLLPLSAWHVALMEVDENPFWYGGKIGLDDIARTIWIFTSKFGDDMFDAKEKERLDKICASIVDMDSDDARGAIADHINDYTKMPIVDSKGSKKKVQATPFAFKAVTGVMSNLHIPEADAWNMPFNRLCCYWFEYLSSQGIIDMTNEQLAEWARGA